MFSSNLWVCYSVPGDKDGREKQEKTMTRKRAEKIKIGDKFIFRWNGIRKIVTVLKIMGKASDPRDRCPLYLTEAGWLAYKLLHPIPKAQL